MAISKLLVALSMLNKIRNIFGGSQGEHRGSRSSLPAVETCSLSLLKKPKTSVPKEWEEIEVYPPMARSLVAEPIDGIIYRNRERILQINEALGLPDDEFDRLMMPVIRNFASFVHLLPSSENHHHRGSGGALKHSLEVAFWSARAAEDVIFCMKGDPATRRKVEPLWRVATCIAGLLHDAGKPIADIEVRDQDGNRWHPLECHLYDWLRNNRIERYFIEWREGRYKRHETFTQRAFDRIVPSEIVTHMMAHDRNIIYRISDAYYGLDDGNHISKIVSWADHESTRRDVAQDVELRTGSDFNYGIPVHRHLFSAARRLISAGRWKVNEPGAKVWHCSEGTFLVWKHALTELIDEVKKETGVNVRKEPDEIADELVQRNMAKPKYIDGQEPDTDDELGAYYLYWVITPKALTEGRDPDSIKLTALKIDTPDRLFANDIPPEAEIKIWATNLEGQPISPEDSLPEGSLVVGGAVVDGSTGEILGGSQDTVVAHPGQDQPRNDGQTRSESEPLVDGSESTTVPTPVLAIKPNTDDEPQGNSEAKAEPAAAEKRMSPLDRMLAGGGHSPALKPNRKANRKEREKPEPAPGLSGDAPKNTGAIPEKPVAPEQRSEEQKDKSKPEQALQSLQSIGDDLDFPFGIDEADEVVKPQASEVPGDEAKPDAPARSPEAETRNGQSKPALSNHNHEAVGTAKVVESPQSKPAKKPAAEPSKANSTAKPGADKKTDPSSESNQTHSTKPRAKSGEEQPGSSEKNKAAPPKTVVLGKHRKPSEKSNSKPLNVQPSSADPVAAYEQFVKDNHAAGRILDDLITSVVDNGEVLGARWFIFESRVTIAYPYAFENGEVEPLDALAELEKHGLLYLNPSNPMRKVLEFDGVNAIALATRPSAIITAYLVSREKTIDPHFVAPSPDLRLMRSRKKVDLMPKNDKKTTPDKLRREKPQNPQIGKAPKPDNKGHEMSPAKNGKQESRKEVGIRLSNNLVEQMVAGEGEWLIGYKKSDKAISVSDMVIDRIALDEPMASKRLLKQYFWQAADAKGYHWDFTGNQLTLKEREKE